MRKFMVAILMMGLMATAFIGCSKGDVNPPDFYDKENYIGAADLGEEMKDMAKEYGITRETMSSFTIDGQVAYMSGDISADTIRQVKKLIKDYPEVKTITMVEVGGSIDDVSNLEASRLVRKAGLNTHVAKDGFIASGGTDFFCAGVVRTAEEGAQVGVHSWAGDGVENAALLAKDHKEHDKYIKYYEEMKMPDPKGFYFFTINAAKADGMYYMTMDEMIQYGLIQ